MRTHTPTPKTIALLAAAIVIPAATLAATADADAPAQLARTDTDLELAYAAPMTVDVDGQRMPATPNGATRAIHVTDALTDHYGTEPIARAIDAWNSIDGAAINLTITDDPTSNWTLGLADACEDRSHLGKAGLEAEARGDGTAQIVAAHTTICPTDTWNIEGAARVIAHEIGHTLGFGHLCDYNTRCWTPDMPADNTCRIMSYGRCDGPILHPRDQAAARRTFPAYVRHTHPSDTANAAIIGANLTAAQYTQAAAALRDGWALRSTCFDIDAEQIIHVGDVADNCPQPTSTTPAAPTATARLAYDPEMHSPWQAVWAAAHLDATIVEQNPTIVLGTDRFHPDADAYYPRLDERNLPFTVDGLLLADLSTDGPEAVTAAWQHRAMPLNLHQGISSWHRSAVKRLPTHLYGPIPNDAIDVLYQDS